MNVDDLEELLLASLQLWSIEATITYPDDDTLCVATPSKSLNISRAPAALPFRWIVESGVRRRTASSVTGLIGHVRCEFDDIYQPARLQFVNNAPEKTPL